MKTKNFNQVGLVLGIGHFRPLHKVSIRKMERKQKSSDYGSIISFIGKKKLKHR